MTKLKTFLFLAAFAVTGAACGGGGGLPQECETYLSKLEKCLEKAPEAQRGGLKSMLDSNRDAWKKAAESSAEAKAALGTTCKQATDALKPMFEAAGCSM